MYYFLKEYVKAPNQGNQWLICLFHAVFAFHCKTDSTKDRKKSDLQFVYIKQARETQKQAKKILIASTTFTCTVSYTAFFNVLKVNSTISIHINNAKLSPQAIFPQKRIFTIRQEDNNHVCNSLCLRFYPEVKKHQWHCSIKYI